MIEQAEAATGISPPSARPPAEAPRAQKRGRSRGFLRVVRSRAADQGGHLFIRLPTAASLVTGSYVSTANLTLRTAQNFTAVSTSCTTGLPSLKIVPANPAGSFSTGTW